MECWDRGISMGHMHPAECTVECAMGARFCTMAYTTVRHGTSGIPHTILCHGMTRGAYNSCALRVSMVYSLILACPTAYIMGQPVISRGATYGYLPWSNP